MRHSRRRTVKYDRALPDDLLGQTCHRKTTSRLTVKARFRCKAKNILLSRWENVKKCQRAHRPLNRPSYQDGLRFRIEAKSGLLTRSRIEDDVNY